MNKAKNKTKIVKWKLKIIFNLIKMKKNQIKIPKKIKIPKIIKKIKIA